MRPTTPLLLAAASLAVGCAPAPKPVPPPPTQHATPVDPAGHPILLHLTSRNHTITITKGPAGPAYSVTDPTGRTLVTRASLEDLRTHHPALYRQLEPALATDASGPGGY